MKIKSTVSERFYKTDQTFRLSTKTQMELWKLAYQVMITMTELSNWKNAVQLRNQEKKKLKVISAYILSLAVFLAPGLAISGTKRLKSRSDAAKIALN